jgi:myo-inositol-1(or 4)-monophosphatase
MSLRDELAVATSLALQAGAALRRHRADGRLLVMRKAGDEPVTAADLESDAIIRRGLADAFPSDALFTEETPDGPERLASRRVWIVDPLDSTSNYISGGDEYSVSIGLAIDRQPALGVVYNPNRDELVAGCLGGGVTLNGTRVGARTVAELGQARVTISPKELQRGLPDGLPTLALRPVASMAYKLARVAAGLDDATVSFKRRKEWGTCAGVALVLASGGRATLLDGRPIAFNHSEPKQACGMLAAGAGLHQQLLSYLRTTSCLRPLSKPT